MNTEQFLNLLDGLLLGDGSISNDNRFSLLQCWKNREWIYIVQQQLDELGLATSITHHREGVCSIGGKSYKRQATIHLRTKRCELFAEQRKRWYPNGIKTVPSDVRLSPISLANWCCGDGYRGGKGYHLTFCTDSFNDTDRELLITRLYELYGWRLTETKSRGRISITKNQDRYEFKKITQQYIPETFQYKLDLKINHRHLIENAIEERERKLARRRQLAKLKRKSESLSVREQRLQKQRNYYHQRSSIWPFI